MIVIDTEASGQCPAVGDMISFAAVCVEDDSKHYKSPLIIPSLEVYDRGAYNAINLSRYDHEAQATHTLGQVAQQFNNWLEHTYPDYTKRIVSWSDNPAFDWQWINHMFHTTIGYNPLGHSMRRIGDLAAGLAGKPSQTSKWKKTRTVKHTHCPLDDARGNAGALRKLLNVG